MMNKEELVQVHTLMVHIKDYFEKRGKGDFSKYNSLQICPAHVHKHKNEHKDAIFTLGKEIVCTMRKEQPLYYLSDSLLELLI